MTTHVQCPTTTHFHISANDVFEMNSFSKVIEANDPNHALELVIAQLDSNWEGNIEIEDHKNFGTCEMPLINFWRTPLNHA